MKPVFLIGTIVTAITFIGTIYGVHACRYDRRAYGYRFADSRATKVLSTVSLVCGLTACLALIFLGGFDTYRFHTVHGILLLAYFGGLGLCAIGTTFVWFDQIKKPRFSSGLRSW